MFNQKIENIIIGNQFIGIEVYSINEVEKVNCIFVKNNKEELTIIDSSEFNSIDEISNSEQTKGIPIILSLNTEKVLTKEIDSIEKNDIVLVKKTFPNLNLEEFYFQIWRFNDKSSISIVRKSYVEQITTIFKEKHSLSISSLYIGISTIKNTINYINEDTVLLNGKTFDKIENLINTTTLNNKTNYQINGLQVSNKDLLSFSSILTFIINDEHLGSVSDLNKNIKNDYFQNSFFKKTTKLTVFSLLALLLINFFIFNHYFKRFNEVSILSEQNLVNDSKVESLKKSVIEKEKKLKEYSISSQEKVSVIVNDIIKSIPNTILLNEIIFQPTEKKETLEKQASYFEKLIVISGKTIDNNDFTEWIDLLSKSEVCKEVTIITFGKDENKNLSFTINIQLNEVK